MDYPKRTEKYDGADPFITFPRRLDLPDNPHEGEEFGYVLLGSITLVLGKRRIKVKKGVSFYFKADSTHYIQAGQKTGAVLIWVSTPPSF